MNFSEKFNHHTSKTKTELQRLKESNNSGLPKAQIRDTINAHVGAFRTNQSDIPQALRKRFDQDLDRLAVQMADDINEFDKHSARLKGIVEMHYQKFDRFFFLRDVEQEQNTKFVFNAKSCSRTCDTCNSLDNKKFTAQELAAAKAIPPLHPNCRCAIESGNGTILDLPEFDGTQEGYFDVDGMVDIPAETREEKPSELLQPFSKTPGFEQETRNAQLWLELLKERYLFAYTPEIYCVYTEEAIRKFQRDYDLAVTGELDSFTYLTLYNEWLKGVLYVGNYETPKILYDRERERLNEKIKKLFGSGYTAAEREFEEWTDEDVPGDEGEEQEIEVEAEKGTGYLTVEMMERFGWLGEYDIDHVNKVLEYYGITDPASIRLFLATCGHESRLGLDPLEDLNDNGSTNGNYKESERGAGYIQSTWRTTHLSFLKSVNDSFAGEDTATYISQKYPWEAAMWFWTSLEAKSTSAGSLNDYVAKYGDSEGVYLLIQYWVNGWPDGLTQEDAVRIRNGTANWSIKGGFLYIDGFQRCSAPNKWNNKTTGRKDCYDRVMNLFKE